MWIIIVFLAICAIWFLYKVAEAKAEPEKPAPAKSKKGKVAMKVALGVMTGGVSLIPDAVSAVKKKSKKDS